MSNIAHVRAKSSLKKLGVQTDLKSRQIDNRFLKTLDAARREEVEGIWRDKENNLNAGLALYTVPQTIKEAALLFSHDWRRSVASNAWILETIADTNANFVVEMGAGPGFLIRLIEDVQGIDDRIALQGIVGIEQLENLARIASEACTSEILTGSYLNLEPTDEFDLVVCNFGFDLADFNLHAPPPHRVAQIGGQSYCPGCSDFLASQLQSVLGSWRRWATSDAHLALTGRIPDPGVLLAFLNAAREAKWELDLERSTFLRVADPNAETEVFPACLFQPSESRSDRDLQAVTEQLYMNSPR